MPHPGQTMRPLVKLGRAPDDCWTWLGPIGTTGHAKKTFAGKDMPAHRWIWEQLFGPIPDGLVVYSTCESKSCINPHHLACGTIADAVRSSVTTKLLPADVLEIKAATEHTSTTAEYFASKFGCSPQLVRDIWRGDAWSRSRKFRGPKRPRNQHTRNVA